MLEQALDLENALYYLQENAPRDRVDKIPRRTARLFFRGYLLGKNGNKAIREFPCVSPHVDSGDRKFALIHGPEGGVGNATA